MNVSLLVTDFLKPYELKPYGGGKRKKDTLKNLGDYIIKGCLVNEVTIEQIIQAIDSPKESQLTEVLDLFKTNIERLEKEHYDADNYFTHEPERIFNELAEYLVSNYDEINSVRLVNETLLARQYWFLEYLGELTTKNGKPFLDDLSKNLIKTFRKYVSKKSLEKFFDKETTIDSLVKVKEHLVLQQKLRDI